MGGAAVVAEFGQRLLLGIGKVEACKGIAMSGILATCSGLAVLSGVALLGGSGASGGILILCKSGKTAKGNSRESERKIFFINLSVCFIVILFLFLRQTVPDLFRNKDTMKTRKFNLLTIFNRA